MLVSHKLSGFCEKCVFCLLLQFAYSKGLGCTDVMLTIFNHFRSPYIVQLDFRAVFDRVSHSGLLFKLISIGVSASVLSICREFLSNCKQSRC